MIRKRLGKGLGEKPIRLILKPTKRKLILRGRLGIKPTRRNGKQRGEERLIMNPKKDRESFYSPDPVAKFPVGVSYLPNAR